MLDDHMFKLWRAGLVDKKDVLVKANSPEELAAKIAAPSRGIFEDEEESKRRMKKGEAEEEEE